MSLFKSTNQAEKKITYKIYGVWVAEESGVRGKPVLPLDIWLHILVILFYPTLTGRRTALSKESPKRNIQKEKIEIDKRRRRFFYTFLYLLGSTTILWMRVFFLNTFEMVESPSLRCQKYTNSFHVYKCPHLVFRASIRVSFFLKFCQKSGKS